MKVDNFVLLIISIVTLIVISLLTECNRGRLTELENKATKEIVETFFHLGSADSTELGQWGYQITGITEGKYGGRSRQQVINKLLEVGSHSENDYITETEKHQYGSDLFDSTISGDIINKTHCQYNNLQIICNKCKNNKLYQEHSIVQTAKYGGDNCDFDLIEENKGYNYITKNSSINCSDLIPIIAYYK